MALADAPYTVAAHCALRRALTDAALVAAFALAFVVPALVQGAPISGAAGEAVELGGVWLLGRWVRRRRHATANLKQLAATLEADREALARDAVAAERAHRARDARRRGA